MPLKRTPPPSSPAPDAHFGAANYDYASAMSSISATQKAPVKQQDHKSKKTFSSKDREDVSNVNIRERRKRTGECEEREQSEFHEFMFFMREMFESFKSDIESRLHDLQVSAVKIQDQNTDITKSVQFMSDKYDESMKRIEKLESEKSENKKYIKILEDRVENFERRSRSSCIEIRNIPKTKDENKQGLCDVLVNLGNILNLKTDSMEIKDIYRTSTSKEQDKPIVVDFCSTLRKDSWIQSIKNFNKNKHSENKLNTEHIKISGIKKPIYISEALTFKAKRLFYLAREFAKLNNYNYCWTSHGIVYLREKERAPFVRITNESDLDELKSTA